MFFRLQQICCQCGALIKTRGRGSSRGILQGCSLCGQGKTTGIHAFQGQQAELFFEASGVSGEAAVRAYHPVAGDEKGNAVVAHRAANRLRGQVGLPPLLGELCGAVVLAIGG